MSSRADDCIAHAAEPARIWLQEFVEAITRERRPGTVVVTIPPHEASLAFAVQIHVPGRMPKVHHIADWIGDAAELAAPPMTPRDLLTIAPDAARRSISDVIRSLLVS